MRLALRLCCVIVLAGAGWALYAAEKSVSHGVSPKSGHSTLKIPARPLPVPTETTVEVAAIASDEEPRPRVARQLTAPAPIAPRSAAVPAVPRPQIETDSQVHISLGTLSPTPDMWYYEQARADYHNPALQVRRRAEADAAQRRQRLAAQEWYGYSNSRPMASCTPFTGTYSPMWGANQHNPYVWTARSTAPVVMSAYSEVGVSGFGYW